MALYPFQAPEEFLNHSAGFHAVSNVFSGSEKTTWVCLFWFAW